MKAKVIPVITDATETISKSLKKIPENVKCKHEIKELQKPATLCPANKLRKVLL